MARADKFHIVMIKPTHYDDEGYPIQWLKSLVPSNSLASLYGIAADAAERQVVGVGVECVLTAIDEINRAVKPKKLIRQIMQDGGKAVICLVGVQSNQFPRAVDLAQPFLGAELPVILGGFHTAGCLSMLDEVPAEIVAAQDAGISIFAGEAENGRFDEVLLDAMAGQLKPLYDYIDDLPDLRDQPLPFLPRVQVDRTFGHYSSFDLGRGCPFQCSFCTIINVQGRVSRFRTADDLEAIIRANAAVGVVQYFLTDDNLARNRNWEEFFDRLILLRKREGLAVQLMVQVDTMCHRIKGFIDKAVEAGVDQVFVGMESINPDTLLAAKKNQNKITEYREMFLAWKKHPVVITTGFIIGFPGDTRETIVRDINIIKRELPVDLMYFTYLTPLPGCEDHKNMLKSGEWMDSDLNKYDLNHRVTHHPMMSDEEWEEVYNLAWDIFYSKEHMLRILKRMTALGSNKKITTIARFIVYGYFRKIYGVHPLEGGIFRLRYRKDRRPPLPRENPLVFYTRYFFELNYSIFKMGHRYLWLRRKLFMIWRNPDRFKYTDAAITPIERDDHENLEIYASSSAQKAIAKQRKQQKIIATARGGS